MERRVALLLGAVGLLVPSVAAAVDERPFLFATDVGTPAPGGLVAGYRVTWGAATTGAVRPIGSAGLGHQGFLHEINAEVGLVDRVSAQAFGLVSPPDTGDTAPIAAAFGGAVRVRVLGRRGGPFQLTVAGGAMRDLSGYAAMQGRVVATGDIGRLRLTGDALVEHSLRPGADAVDLIVVAGASYAVVPWLRAGVEYVGQDLEGAFDDGEVEGVRHLVGPTVSFFSAAQRLQFVGGCGFGLSAQSPGVVARGGVVYTF